MAGFEVIVRPMILPDIRPAAVPRLPSPGAADQSLVVLSGGGGSMISITNSESTSASRSKEVETKRTFDVDRIYQKEDDGTLNKDNFVDTERLTKLETRGGGGKESQTVFGKPPSRDNVETLETGAVRAIQPF